MEFPPESNDVFDSEQFETARARLAGDAVMEVMLQMRPNGRCLDHYRIALDNRITRQLLHRARCGSFSKKIETAS